MPSRIKRAGPAMPAAGDTLQTGHSPEMSAVNFA